MKDYRAYWEQNVDKWAELYLDISHGDEALNAPNWLSRLYKGTAGRWEARLMRERYALTMAFVDRFVRPGTRFADVGCGTGIFTIAALRRGAHVIAIDFSERALEVTRENVARNAQGHVEYLHANLEREPIPDCDVALAMGVTPYIADLPAFLDNILPHAQTLYCQYTDPSRPSNVVRRLIPALNVRKLIFHSTSEVDAIYRRHDRVLQSRASFATGFIDLTSRAA